MGNHSMRNKEPGTVASVGPIFLETTYRKFKIGKKKAYSVVRQYTPNRGPNRHERKNAARIAHYADRQGWATKPKAAQLRHEYQLGLARKKLKATEGAK